MLLIPLIEVVTYCVTDLGASPESYESNYIYIVSKWRWGGAENLLV
jgi:hypothetical protein